MKIPKYTQKELFGMLSNIGRLNIHRWSMVMTIVENMDKIDIVEKQWVYDNFKNNYPEYYPLDLSNIETWSTYDNSCIDLVFSVDRDSKLKCVADIYDGYSMTGERTFHRFRAVLKLPNDFIKHLNDTIHYKFNSFLEDLYEQHLSNLKNDWIERTRSEFMQHFKS